MNARSGEGPVLVEAKVLRLTSNSTDDDQRRYRDAGELEAEKQRDSLLKFRSQLIDLGVISENEASALRTELVVELDRAQEEAEAAPLPEPASALHHVLGERS